MSSKRSLGAAYWESVKLQHCWLSSHQLQQSSKEQRLTKVPEFAFRLSRPGVRRDPCIHPASESRAPQTVHPKAWLVLDLDLITGYYSAHLCSLLHLLRPFPSSLTVTTFPPSPYTSHRQLRTFRNPATQQYARLLSITADCILLLSNLALLELTSYPSNFAPRVSGTVAGDILAHSKVVRIIEVDCHTTHNELATSD